MVHGKEAGMTEYIIIAKTKNTHTKQDAHPEVFRVIIEAGSLELAANKFRFEYSQAKYNLLAIVSRGGVKEVARLL